MSTGTELKEVKERSSSADGAGAPDSIGEWSCGDSECRHVNFGRRTSCQKCQRERSEEEDPSSGTGSSGSGGLKKKLGTEIGKVAAEKSRGLFSAEDWQCSKCANVNWARRQTCNMCNAPKFCDVEERTGYGGGYNDRGVVEYKERPESDSEYDEFGRLKKRQLSKNHKKDVNPKAENKKPARKANDNTDNKNEESSSFDEEDDDGDGDLSKYDLWGDDEIAAVAAKPANEEKPKAIPEIKKLSRSRSFSNSSESSSSSSSSSSSTSSSSSSSSSSRSHRSRIGRSGSSSSANKVSRSRSRNRQPEGRVANDERSNSQKETVVQERVRERSKTHSQQSHSSRKSARSRSTSSSRRRQDERKSGRNRSRSPRSRSPSRKYSKTNAQKYKRSNNSRSPASRYQNSSRTRSRSRSLSTGRRRR